MSGRLERNVAGECIALNRFLSYLGTLEPELLAPKVETIVSLSSISIFQAHIVCFAFLDTARHLGNKDIIQRCLVEGNEYV